MLNNSFLVSEDGGSNISTGILDTPFTRSQEVTMGLTWLIFGLLGNNTVCVAYIIQQSCQFNYHFCLGILGNGLTLVVLLRAKSLYNSSTPYLISITICDLLASTFVLPFLGVSGLSGRVLYPVWLCKLLSLGFHILHGNCFNCLMTHN